MNRSFRDPGLPFERTQLAWQRYVFSVAVVALLCVRAGVRGHHPAVGFALAFVLAGLAAVLQFAGPRIGGTTAIRAAFAVSLVAAAGSLLLALL